ncbi:hypothetical protein D3C80_2167780 [compost metagenome]
MSGEYRQHVVTFLEHDGVAFCRGHERVITQAVDRQLDLAKPDFKLATFTTG